MAATILQLERIPIYPPTNGRERRVWETTKALAAFGFVSLVRPGPEQSDLREPATNNATGVEFVDVDNRFLSSDIPRIQLWNAFKTLGAHDPYDRLQTRQTVRTVRRLDIDPDLVVVESPQLGLAARRIASEYDAALLVDKHNASFELLDRFLSSSPIPSFVVDRAVDNLRAFEQAVVDNADAVVYQSVIDRERFDPPHDGKVATIPNGTDVSTIRNGGDPAAVAAELKIDEDADVCVFVGSFDYVANHRAAKFIANAVAPELPDTEFVLAGRKPPTFDRSNIHAPGFVEDLASTLALADVGLCPISIGSGTNLKILDYMAAGLPTVTTELGTTGLDIADGESVVVAETATEFVAAIKRLQSDSEFRKRLSVNAASLADDYDWDVLMADYGPIVEDLLDRRVDT